MPKTKAPVETIRVGLTFAVARKPSAGEIAALFKVFDASLHFSLRQKWAEIRAGRSPFYPVRVVSLQYGSPFHVLLDVPVAAGGIGALLGLVGTVVGGPFFIGKKFHQQRRSYWTWRLKAARAKHEYRMWARNPETFQLIDVEVPDHLPPAWEEPDTDDDTGT